MKISYNWLKDYLDIEISAEKAAELLTFGGLEVEDVETVETIKGGLKNYVVGKVLTCEMHPNSDHLHITTVDVGTAEPLHIVCGAPNVAAGQKVVVAKIGAKVYTSDEECFEIKRSKLRGELSEGMICSEKELCLSENNDGIMVLDESAVAGTPAKEFFDIKEDYIFEIGLTANRSDATSHIGVARDLAALLKAQLNENKNLKVPQVDSFATESNTNDDIEIKIDTALCKRYSAVTISGVKVAESPQWLADRLRVVGIRPINNIVDVTNYVLMECGQPLHAFDLNHIEGRRIEVKTVAEGTKFTTLDGVERALNGKEAMVCNANRPMCMGGIYGGAESGVSNTTTDILIESAYFDPVVIRKAAKYHTLKTDASFRYERGADPNITVYALKRAALLIKELAGGTISSQIKDVYPQEIAPVRIHLDYSAMDRLVGKQIDRVLAQNILNYIGIETTDCTEEGLVAIVPTNKVDVTRPCDLIEEILRIYGYNNVEISDTVKSCITQNPKPDPEQVQNLVSDYLASNGFNEAMNNSLTKVAYYENNSDFPQEESVMVLNALSKDLGQMRQTLLYGLLETIGYNINRQTSDLRLFEFGNCYKKNIENFESDNITKRYKQNKRLSMVTTGKSIETWQAQRVATDFFYLKNIFTNILSLLRIDTSRLVSEQTSNGFYQYALSFKNKENKKTVATIGMLKPAVCKKFGIKQEVFFADVDWDLIMRMLPTKSVRYEEISKYPEVRRDLALILDKDVSFAQIEQIAMQTEKKLLKSVSLFDVYQSDKLPEGKKQYAIALILQDKEKTLTDKQIDAIVQKLLKAFEQKVGATLR